MLYFERLDILCAWFGYPSEMLWPFQFLKHYHFWISSVLIYHGTQSYTHVKSYGRLNSTRASLFNFERLVNYVPKSDIRVKSYDHLNFSRTSTFEFRACRYIMGLNRKSMSKVMAVLTGPELPCSISSVSINYVPESDIRVKSYDHLNFSRTSTFEFRACRYIMGLNRKSMLKVMAG